MQGQLIRPDGSAIETASVDFTIQLLSTNDECLLLEETYTINMTGSSGIFNLSVGNGTNTGAGGLTSVDQSIDNSLALLSGLTCASGTTYDPQPGDTRRVRITYDEGAGPLTLSEDHILQSVPYAMYAGTLGGKTANEFIQANTTTAGVTQANIETIFDAGVGTNYTELLALLAGTSSQYSQIGASGAESLPIFDNTSPPTTPIAGDMWFNSDTSTVQFHDGTTTQNIGTGTVTNIATGSGLTGGPITNTGTVSVATGGITNTHLGSGIDASKITVGTLPVSVVPSGTDSTKLPLAGGTMTGAITMGDFNIINPGDITNLNNLSFDGTGQADFNDANLVELGFVTMMPERSLHLGNFTDAQEATYVATPLVAADAGKTWFNTDDSTLKYWDGTQVVDLQSQANDKLPLAGGQMTGNIDLNNNLMTNIKNLSFNGVSGTDNVDFNSQYLLNTGHITISAQHVLGLGGYTNAQETTYVGSLGAADVGSVWYNTDTNQLKMWTNNINGEVIGAIGNEAGFSMAADAVPNCTTGQKLQMSATSPYTWSCVTENGDIEGVTAGSALSGGGTTGTLTLNVNVDNIGIEVNGSDQLQLKDNGVTSAKIDNGTIVSADIAVDTITSGNIAVDTITAADVAPNAIEASELADNAVDTAAIQSDAVTSAKIDDGTIVSADVAADTITSGNIALDTIAAADVAPNAIEASELADNAVDTAAILDDAVTAAKVSEDIIKNGGNSAGAAITIGTEDTNNLNIETDATTRMTVTSVGDIGVGVLLPESQLHLTGSLIVGDDGNNCDATHEGQIKYNAIANEFQVCDNSLAWQTIAIGSAVGDIQAVTAGDGLSGGGTSGAVTLDINVDDSTIETNADTLRVKDGGIVTVKIADDAITSAKIDDGTVVSGDIAADTITSGNIAIDTIAAADVAPNAIEASELADNAVDTAAIQSDAVTSSKIDDGTVVSGDIAADTITSGNIAVDTIAAADVAPNAIEASELADNAVDTAAIQSDAVTSAKIDDGTIVSADVAADTITSGNIALDTIAAADVAPNAIEASELADNAVDTAAILDDAVTAAKVSEDIIKNGGNSAGATITIGTEDTNNLNIETDATTRMIVTSTGDIGIGVLSPDSSLHLAGTLILGDDGEGCDATHEGALKFDLATSTLLFCDDSLAWQTIATGTGVGDIQAVTAGDGLSGGGTSGAVTLDINVDDSTIETNADTLRVKDGGIVTVKIADDAITSAKIDDGTVVSGDIAADTITSGNIAVDTIAAVDVAPNAIEASELADNAVDTAAIQSDAVTSAKIDDGTIVSADVAADTITSGNIALDTIAAADVAPNAIEASELADNAVDTAAIIDDAVTAAKVSEDIIKNGGNSAGAAITIGTEDTNNLNIETDATTRMTVTSTGDIGIGVLSPDSSLHLAGTLILGDDGEGCDATHEGALKFDLATSTLLFCDDSLAWQTIATGTGVGDIQAVTAGDGLSGGGTSGAVTIDINVDDSTIETNADTLRVKDGGIVTVKIADDAITSAKIDDGTVVSGDIAADTITSGNIAIDTIAAADVAPNAIEASELADDAVDTAAIQSDAVTSSKIDDGTVVSGDIAADTITSGNIAVDTIAAADVAPNAIEASELADNAVDTAAIQSGAVTSAKIDDGTIATVDLANGSVTDAKIGTVSIDKIINGASKYFTYQPNNTACADGEILHWVDANTRWECASAGGGGDITGVTAGDGLIGGGATGGVTLNLNVDDSTVEINADTLRLKDAGVTTTKLAADSVTSAKIDDGTIATVDLAADSVTSAKIDDGTIATIDLAADSVTSAKIDDGTIATVDLAADSVTSAKIDDGTIVSADVAANTITSANIAIDTIAAADVAPNAIEASELADNAVDTAAIQSDAITSAKIDDGTIATVDLANGSVTDAKIGTVSIDKIINGASKYFTYQPNNTACADGEILHWVDANTRWECTSIGGGGDITGVTAGDGLIGGGATGGVTLNLNVDDSTVEINADTLRLKDAGVTTTKLAADSVTSAKIDDGTIATVDLAADSVTSAKIDDGTIATVDLAVDSVTSAKIDDGTVVSGDIAADTITSGNIAVDTIAAADVAPNAIEASELADNAVDTAAIQSGAVTSAKIDDGTIATVDLANGSVTDAKIGTVSIDKIINGASKYFTYQPNNTACADGEILHWVNANTRWECTSIGGGGDITGVTAGDGLIGGGATGGVTLNLNVDDSTVEINADTLRVKDAGITTAKLATDSVTSAKIDDGTIATVDLAADSVTSAKIDDGTIATIDLAADSVTSAKIDDGTIATVDLAADSVTSAKIDDGTIVSADVAANTITSANIAIDTIAAADVAPNAIEASELADNAVDTAAIQSGAVTSAKIDDGTIATVDLANGSVTDAKIGTVSIDKIINGASKYFTYQPNNTACADGEILHWVDANTRWECTSIGGGGDITGVTAGDGLIGGGATGGVTLNLNVDDSTVEINADTLRLKDAGVTTAKLATDSVTSAKIDDGTIAAVDLAADSVTSAKIDDGTITTSDIASNTITGGNIASDTITNSDLALDSVGASELADNAVDTNAILDGSVDSDKILDSTITSSDIALDTITSADIDANAIGSSELASTAVTGQTALGSNAAATDTMLIYDSIGSALKKITISELNASFSYSIDDLTDAISQNVNDNLMIGDGSGASITGSARFNTGLGHQSLNSLSTGESNVGIGDNALESVNSGFSNVGIGAQAGDNITTGSRNITIGAGAVAVSSIGDDQLNIGNTVYGDLATNKIGIGVTDPKTELDVGGAVKVGTTAITCDSDREGAVRYNSDKIEYCDGSSWIPGTRRLGIIGEMNLNDSAGSTCNFSITPGAGGPLEYGNVSGCSETSTFSGYYSPAAPTGALTSAPGIKFTNLPAGDYKVFVSLNGYSDAICNWDIHDGSTVGGFNKNIYFGELHELTGYFSYTSTQASITFRLRADEDESGAVCQIDSVGTSTPPHLVNIKVIKLN